MAVVNVNDMSETKLLLSDFNKGDNAIPFDTKWIGPGPGTLKAGDFDTLGIGVQAQEGGRWLGGDPKDPPYVKAGGTITINITKVVS
jgi:hypothetical protein